MQSKRDLYTKKLSEVITFLKTNFNFAVSTKLYYIPCRCSSAAEHLFCTQADGGASPPNGTTLDFVDIKDSKLSESLTISVLYFRFISYTIQQMIKPGVRVGDIYTKFNQLMEVFGLVKVTPDRFESCFVSINEIVTHGQDHSRIVKAGDNINLDFVFKYKNIILDGGFNVNNRKYYQNRFVNIVRNSLCSTGSLSSISKEVEKFPHCKLYCYVHGIGKNNIHIPPYVYSGSYGDAKLEENKLYAIEFLFHKCIKNITYKEVERDIYSSNVLTYFYESTIILKSGKLFILNYEE